MLSLNSPRWAKLSHAYGNASDVPGLITKQRPGTRDPSSFKINFGRGNDTFNHNVPITWPSNVVGL